MSGALLRRLLRATPLPPQPPPAAEATLTSRAFITTIFEPEIRAAFVQKVKNATFWSRIETEKVRVRMGKVYSADPNRVFWMAALATHKMPAAASSEPERVNSTLTALVTGKRNSLSPTRIGQLGWMRMVLRGKHARVPRWRRKRVALPAVAAASASAGAGAGAIAAIFQPKAAPAAEFETVDVEDDGIERDLLEVAEDAIVLGGDEEELEVELELVLARSAEAADTGDSDSDADGV